MDDPLDKTLHSGDHADDPRLVEAVQAYLAETEAGRRPMRRTFLARYPDLGQELEDCLDGLAFVHSAAGGLQSQAPASEPEIEPATAKPLGDFQLIREIGRGGMGVVYEAEQISLGRRVALKILPTAAALDPRQLQRFRNESLAIAQLHHTNIVPVYAVGCERSVHYYAMQLIDGQSLSQVIKNIKADQNKDHATSPSASLATMRDTRRSGFYRAVAELGVQAADGLAYAHRMGVVHRDVKPGNLLLDTHGTLWIADFGLAQLQANPMRADNPTLTRPGDMLGTLRYMSPEQASGRAVLLDQRTDVYSLGATLFELLTLRHAMPGQDQLVLHQQIKEDEPPSARTVDPKVPIALDLILRRAMAKDPCDRYPSADEFAADLRRFLVDQPIKAKAPSLTYQLGRWGKRHRKGLYVGIGTLMFASLALLTTTILVTRANQQVEQALRIQRQRTEQAELAYRQAREVLDRFTRFAAEDMADKPLANDDRRAMLTAALDYYQQFLQTRSHHPQDAGQLALARQAVDAILAEMTASDLLRRTGERAELLAYPPVRDELGIHLSRSEMDRLHDAFALDPFELSDLKSSQRANAYQQVNTTGEKALSAILTPTQRIRLDQITWQVQGVRALGDPSLIRALKLTEQQQQDIGQIRSEIRDQWERFNASRVNPHYSRRPRQGMDAESIPTGQQQDQARAEAIQKALTHLTEEQRAKWQQLLGQPFDITRLPRRLGTGLGPAFGAPHR